MQEMNQRGSSNIVVNLYSMLLASAVIFNSLLPWTNHLKQSLLENALLLQSIYHR